MLKKILKVFLFPLLGVFAAIAYPFFVEDHFKEEEIKFEAATLIQPNQTTLKGLTDVNWNGKKVLAIEGSQVSFPFSNLQTATFCLQATYFLKSGGAVEKIKILLNESLLTEVLLKPTNKNPGQFNALIPFYRLKGQENILTIVKSGVEPTALYFDSLKIRNYSGYSSGLIAAHVLPHPLNPPLLSRIQAGVHKNNLFLFPLAFSLFGLIYGLILSRRRRSTFFSWFNKGAIVFLPSFCLLVIIAAISRISSGHILLSVKSFAFLNAALILVAILRQLNLLQPLIKTSCRLIREILRKKDFVILALVAMTFLMVLSLFSFKFNKNITGFMVIGDYFEAPQIWTSQTLIHRGSVGYDGQFYYYMAHDPFILGQSYNHIDFPAYRYQRIIYPLTAWLLSLGQPKLIPYMMVAVNLLGILVGTFFIIGILKHFGRSPWYSLFYCTSWGFLLCLLRSLPEPLALTFVVIAVYAYLKREVIWQVISLTLAALTQETTLLVSIAFLFYLLREKEFKRSLYMLWPFLGYLFWQFYIFFHFQSFSFLGGTQNFGPPLWGIIEKLYSLGQGGLSLEKVSEFLFLLLILFLIVMAFFEVYNTPTPLSFSFFGYALMTVFLNKLIWVEPWSYARATLGLLVFNLLIFTKEGNRINLYNLFIYPMIFFLSLLSMKLL